MSTSFARSRSQRPSSAGGWYTLGAEMPAPLENCPDVEDCLADPSEIGRVCTFAPLCGTCAVYRVIEGRRGLLLGTWRIRTERRVCPCTAPVCDSYQPRAGARPAPVVQIARAPRPRRQRRAPPPRPPP